MDKEKLMDLVNTNFNKFQLEIKRFYKEEYVVSLEQQCKKQKEAIDKAIEFIKNGDLLYLANKNSVVYRNNIEIRAVADRLNNLLQILEDKEVSE